MQDGAQAVTTLVGIAQQHLAAVLAAFLPEHGGNPGTPAHLLSTPVSPAWALPAAQGSRLCQELSQAKAVLPAPV